MHKWAWYALVAVLVMAAAAGLWRWRAAHGPPEPLVMADLSSIDPLSAKLIEKTLAEVRLNPRNGLLRGKLAMVYHANGLTDLAAVTYEQAIALQTNNPRWWYHLAALRRNTGDQDGALAALDRVTELDATYAPAHWQRGFRMLELGRDVEAESSFRRAIELVPADPTGPVGLARVHMQRKEFEPAARILEPLIGRFPQAAYLHQLLGTTYQHLGRSQEARAELAKTTGQRPRWPDPWTEEREDFNASYRAVFVRADRYVATGRIDEGLKLLQQLRKYRPTDPVLLSKIGEIHLGKVERNPSPNHSSLDLALNVLEAAISYDPNYFGANYNLARAYRIRNDARKALIHINRAIKANPTVGSAYLEKAQLFLDAQNLPAVEKALLLATRNGITDPPIHLRLAQVQIELKNWEAAVQTLEGLVRRDPNSVTALALLAQSKGELGDFAGASTAIERAAALAPQNDSVKQIAARLRTLQQGGR